MRDVHSFIWLLAYECLETCSGLYIPEFDCSVITATGKRVAVRAESNLSYAVGVTLKRLKALPGIDIPEANRLIFATAGKHISIVVKGNRSNPAAMPL